MTAGTLTDPDFAFAGLATPEAATTEAAEALAAGPDRLGALAGLVGTRKGHGFNAIWRPHHPGGQQDRFRVTQNIVKNPSSALQDALRSSLQGKPDTHQLQYTQLVMLDFNGIHWPHVTVGTLVRQ